MMYATENVCMWNASSVEVCTLHVSAISNVCMYVCGRWMSLLVHILRSENWCNEEAASNVDRAAP